MWPATADRTISKRGSNGFAGSPHEAMSRQKSIELLESRKSLIHRKIREKRMKYWKCVALLASVLLGGCCAGNQGETVAAEENSRIDELYLKGIAAEEEPLSSPCRAWRQNGQTVSAGYLVFLFSITRFRSVSVQNEMSSSIYYKQNRDLVNRKSIKKRLFFRICRAGRILYSLRMQGRCGTGEARFRPGNGYSGSSCAYVHFRERRIRHHPEKREKGS